MLNNKIKVFVTCLTIGNVATATPATVVTKDQAAQALTGLSVPFEENRGQADSKVAFQAKTLAGPLFVTKTGELVWSLASPSPIKSEHSKLPPKQHSQAKFVGPPAPTYSVVEKFIGGEPQPAGAVPEATQVNYFHGNDKSKWQNSVPTWNQVSLGEVWPGIDVKLAARGKNVEKLFTVAPGAAASNIALKVDGGKLAIASNGGLQVENNGRALVTFTAPVAWQEINGQRKPVTVAYRLAAANQYGFTLGVHDATQPVIIDPLLQSTYLGGNSNDWINAIAVTADAVYVAGSTFSSNFPGTSGGAFASFGGGIVDAYVAKLSLDLKSLTQASYLGGSSNDNAYALNLSSSAVYVAGNTVSSNFPGTSGGAQASNAGSYDAFVAKLSLDLKTLTQASFLGGSYYDEAFSLNVDSSAVYVVGHTYSSNFPVVSGGAQASCGGCSSYDDAFVAKLSLDLTSLTQASFLGGNGYDNAFSLNVSSNAVYVAGYTSSSNLPGVSDGAQASFGGDGDVYVAKLSLDLKSLIQASYLGGSGSDEVNELSVSSSAVYVAGSTWSYNFPGTSGGAQASNAGSLDGFVAKLSLDLKSLTQASFLGGSGEDRARALNVSSSAVYVTGHTASSNFYGTSGGAQASNAGSYDAFVAKLSLDLKSLTQASFLGRSSYDGAIALNVSSSAVYVAGHTASSNFPGTSGGAQASFGGGDYDAFVSKLTPDLRAEAVISVPNVVTNAALGITATAATLNGTVTPNGAATSATFDFGLTTTYGTSITATPATIAATAAATSVSASKTGLTCGTAYHYRVKAINSAGTSYGVDKSFSTSTCPPQPINGTCGTANGGTFTTAPTTNLCSTGTASGVNGTGPWTWNCAGSNGGTTASCSANLANSGQYTVTPSVVANGTISPNTPQTVTAGSLKSFTVTPSVGYIKDFVVAGTCPQGSWNEGSRWTTGPITANCSVIFNFTESPTAWLSPTNPYATVSGKLTLDLRVDSYGSPINSYNFNVNFDPTKLRIDSTFQDESGTCQSGVCRGANALSNISANVDVVTGKIALIGFDNQVVAQSNNLDLVKIHFLAMPNPAVTSVTLTLVNLLTNGVSQNIGNGITSNALVTVQRYKCGDANGDSLVNIVDALSIARQIIGLPPPPSITPVADVNGNGEISIVDAMHIARYSVGFTVVGTCLM